jgi:hypothetical protein
MTMHALLEAEPGAASVKQVQSPAIQGKRQDETLSWILFCPTIPGGGECEEC